MGLYLGRAGQNSWGGRSEGGGMGLKGFLDLDVCFLLGAEGYNQAWPWLSGPRHLLSSDS